MLTQDILESVNKACIIISYNMYLNLSMLHLILELQRDFIYLLILSAIDGITLPEHLACSRLPARPGDTRARQLIRVGLSSIEDVRRVRGRLSSLPDGISATSDKTFGQRTLHYLCSKL